MVQIINLEFGRWIQYHYSILVYSLRYDYVVSHTHDPEIAPTLRTKEHELEDLLRFFVATPNQPLPAGLDPSKELSRKSLLAAAAGRSAVVPPVVVFSKVRFI